MAYFSTSHNASNDPFVGLFEAASVVKTLRAFCLSSDKPFEQFEHDADTAYGLGVIFDCVANAIETASAELQVGENSDLSPTYTVEDIKRARQDGFEDAMKKIEAVKDTSLATAEETPLSREASIVDALKNGSSTDINVSSAVDTAGSQSQATSA